ncbi:Pls/PosA family non-ribosomal peptide synthetase [Ornithinimicrobium pratense]|uniref:Amino acid adenylation domain-containing protein n=1 Tax=Ornithinimicrobium pratense TaxID=2593973 RepID=A0A5J6V9P0_9MICO|nr:Pls/PosA family non-ribosomal peptide synthetase [Ornithinimicrobium pratense]QFG69883.1 amino acid adenylation domain-containing protein [Ornithinimicrobium pratense]
MDISQDLPGGPPSVPAALLAGQRAPSPRTLVDILRRTVEDAPDALAIDSGVHTLTYAELAEAAEQVAARLAVRGVGRGAKVGIRVSSGTTDLYTAILGVLVAGAAYVPVDADDPDERARVVFDEADVAAVIGNGLAISPRPGGAPGRPGQAPTPDDDAWVIFTSGSTGTPKGVAVTHRNAAAFVDAESRMFLAGDLRPLGPGDRVMAGLSVAFDASCEEMWLAWASGAALVPAPRSLVRAGVDVGPWLRANNITVVSTVPTLVALWPTTALEQVRLLILGGEACPPELAARLQAPARQVWNTYGPTEATVVACAAILDGTAPVRIGLPLDGWDLAVVDEQGQPVPEGATGQLIIGGVGLARYLDPAKDAELYAPMPSLGWQRAYRSGDIVVNDPAGLLFGGRADEQIKLGGRRIELGEIDGQLLRLPGVVGAAAAVRHTTSGNQLLVGYLAVDDSFAADTAQALLRERMPDALVPRLAVVEDLPTRTSGKIDRDALPWPLPGARASGAARLTPLQEWIAQIWADVLGAQVTSPGDDFFAFGGGSLTAAQIVGRLRERFPEVAVGDLYAHPTVGGLAALLEELGAGPARVDRTVRPIPPKTQVGQVLALLPLRTLAAGRWIAWTMLVSVLAGDLLGLAWAPELPWLVVALTAALFLVPPVRMGLAALLIRVVLRGVGPGSYPRGGKVHLRLWLADRIQTELAAVSAAGAPWLQRYARALGADIAPGVDLHALPPVTGFLRIGSRAAVEPEVDLGGTWIDGDRVHVGQVTVRAGARVGARSMLGPGADVGREAEVAPGSFVLGQVPAGEYWSGAPATRVSRRARGAWTDVLPPPGRAWWWGYAAASLLVAVLPVLAVGAGALVVLRLGWVWLPLAALVGYAVLALLVLLLVRVCARAIRPGHHPTRSGRGLAVWTTIRVLDEARTWLFPLYAGALTPVWLRLLGARVGRGVEASTVLLIPSLAQVNDHAFLADDTLIGGYELSHGWMRVERVKVGKRAFVGNSGMVSAGRKVPREALVAVLSAAPRRKSVKAGSSYLGSPPTRLRRSTGETDTSRTYAPPRRLRVARGLIETLRLVPLLLHVLLHLGVAVALLALLRWHVLAAFALGGVVMLAAGVVAALVAWAAKWMIVGRHTAREHPLWSSFVWRNELADAFTEVLAAPWFASVTQGTVVLNVWLRMLGARIGRGVWCDTYWLPETDLVDLRDGATVNHGCVVQTHLFHDRVLSMDTVTLEAGATLGPNSVILPAATLGRHCTVGPLSLVMRGEYVPAQTRWIGNPIGPWDDTPEPTTSDDTSEKELAR